MLWKSLHTVICLQLSFIVCAMSCFCSCKSNTLIMFRVICIALICSGFLRGSLSVNFPGTTVHGQFPCHCLLESECVTDRSTEGIQCASGCALQGYLDVSWSGTGCQTGNIVQGAAVTQSGNSSHTADIAIDGELNPTSFVDSSHPGGPASFWRADLDGLYVAGNVTVWSLHADTLNVAVSDGEQTWQNCRLLEQVSRYNTIYNCSTSDPVSAVHVTYLGEPDRAFSLAEIQVFGYYYQPCSEPFDGAYYYGPGCLLNCNCDQQCDDVTGECPGSCDPPGYQMPYCQDGCPHGWWGAECQNECHCTVACDIHTGACGGACTGNFGGESCQNCTADYWSTECDKPCNCEEPCDQITGLCPADCQLQYYGSSCQQFCDCNQPCDRDDGDCNYRCERNTWGERCEHECRCSVKCLESNGTCPGGVCEPGYVGRSCENACPAGFWGERCSNPCHCVDTCDHVSGRCEQCLPGYSGSGSVCQPCDDDHWGEECAMTCNCDRPCNKQTGGGCQSCLPGYMLSAIDNSCQEMCTPGRWGEGCQGNCNCEEPCDPVSGICGGDCIHRYAGETCQICDEDHWGDDCSTECHCSVDCNDDNGFCNDLCDYGYHGNACDKICNDFIWGPGCKWPCNCTQSCNRTTGYCGVACLGNFMGDYCNECVDGFWGEDCSHECPECEDACSRGNGTCVVCPNNRTVGANCDRCVEGYWGGDCSRDCHCSEACNKANGNCPGVCDEHFQGNNCQQCETPFWGSDCNSDCHCSTACNKTSGYCPPPGVCVGNYAGNDCQNCDREHWGEICTDLCHCIGPCRRTDSFCEDGCDVGFRAPYCQECDDDYWGEQCDELCHCTSHCNRSNALCFSGECDPGYDIRHNCQLCDEEHWGPLCEYECHCSVKCDVESGRCSPPGHCDPGYTGLDERCDVPCDDGWWGVGCVSECHCTVPCNKTSGECLSVGGQCLAGYAGNRCDHCDDDHWGDDCQLPCNCQTPCRDNAHGMCDSQCDPGYAGYKCSECHEDKWGAACDKECHCSVACNRTSGECSGSCDSGYHGFACQETCSPGTWGPDCASACSCGEYSCDRYNGSCADCPSNFKGDKCEDCTDDYWGPNCEFECHCALSCERRTGHCTDFTCTDVNCKWCDDGYGYENNGCFSCDSEHWGNDCQNECHCSVACNTTTGECPGTCDPGFTGSSCQNCENDFWGESCDKPCRCSIQCDPYSGRCDEECDPGYAKPDCQNCTAAYWGTSCSQQCHCSVKCNEETAYCPSGVCTHNRTGEDCQDCNVDYYGSDCTEPCYCIERCDRDGGSCIGRCKTGYIKVESICQPCEASYWGDDCANSCHCSEPCNHINGRCSGDCLANYAGERCDECANGYWGDECENQCMHCHLCSRTTGICDPETCIDGFKPPGCENCMPGKWGPLCNADCHCSQPCERNGTCPGECAAGYRGINCQNRCESGTWGHNCVNNCYCNEECDAFTGNCNAGCEPGYNNTLGAPCEECPNDTWGEDCAHECYCSEPCNKVNGVCGGLCNAGRAGATCQETCDDQHWGNDCMGKCHCEDCDKKNGSCLGKTCNPGRHGHNCLFACRNGIWGLDCTRTCHCFNNNVCNKVTGACPEPGCDVYYYRQKDEAHCEPLPRLGHFELSVDAEHSNGRHVVLNMPSFDDVTHGSAKLFKVHINSGEQIIEVHPANITAQSTFSFTLSAIGQSYGLEVYPYDVIDGAVISGQQTPRITWVTNCRSGMWGNDCQYQCGCAQPDMTCDQAAGTGCLQCHEGYFGLSCNLTISDINIDVQVRFIGMDVIVDKTGGVAPDGIDISYIIQYRLLGDENWKNYTVNTRTRRSTGDSYVYHPNSQYQVRTIPVIHDASRAEQYRRVECEPSNITLIESDCGHFADVSHPDEDGMCNNWCDCSDQYCLLTEQYCNAVCNHCTSPLPMRSSIRVKLIPSTYYIDIIVISDGGIETFDVLYYTERRDYRNMNITSNVTARLSTLEKNTLYYIRIFPLLEYGGTLVHSPGLNHQQSTLLSEADPQTPVLLIFVIGTACVLFFVLVIVIFVAIKRRQKKKQSEVENQTRALGSTEASGKSDHISLKYYSGSIVKHPDAAKELAQTSTQYDDVGVFRTTQTDVRTTQTDEGIYSDLDYDYLYNHTNSSCGCSKRVDLTAINTHVPNTISDEDVLKAEHAVLQECKTYANISLEYTSSLTTYELNACYVRGYKDTMRYVACQTPKPAGIDDMWRMVWNLKSPLVIMLDIVSQRYWPSDCMVVNNGKLTIKLKSKTLGASLVSRELELTMGGESRTVMHLQFTDWNPDETPQSINDYLEFYYEYNTTKCRLHEENKDDPDVKPVIVHCSSGVGRSGVFITIDYMMEQLQRSDDGHIDVLQTICTLRKCKPGLVDTPQQYRCIYMFLAEELKRSFLVAQAYIDLDSATMGQTAAGYQEIGTAGGGEQPDRKNRYGLKQHSDPTSYGPTTEAAARKYDIGYYNMLARRSSSITLSGVSLNRTYSGGTGHLLLHQANAAISRGYQNIATLDTIHQRSSKEM